ncbi:uncharacterized protein EV420DRAFT_1684500 [Desarmillaria tabescens]|uniref:F-box domain-containing protein n=1 Tax=Armillaria tabescens TaxID=1929756 RepID=A0AA39NLG9_ARMTA|nr:uncharacterized protein EV420DRAFT_1684500 [Desarmillaria tabescens]KAK0467838.1 hypothetical protein EV420DRAFT_1684500 [Desarmillaria tabescens]
MERTWMKPHASENPNPKSVGFPILRNMVEILSSSVIPCNHCGYPINQCEYRDSFPPPVWTALRTGQQVYTLSDATSYSSTISTMHSQLAIWENDIQHLEAALDNLKTDHRNLSRYASSYQSMLAPVRCLPVEILLTIFEEACSELGLISFQDQIPYYWKDEKNITLYGNTPVYLASVCYYWRSICLSTPKLWTHSYVFACRPSLSSATANLILLFNERSKPLPLSISISAVYDTEFDHDCYCGRYRDDEPLDFDSLDELLGFGELEDTLVDSQRLRRLCLDVECRHLSDYPPLPFSQLEQLEISGSPSDFRDRGTSLFEDTFNYSNLRELRLSRYDSHKDLHLPWKQIETLQLCNLNDIAILAVFSGVKRVTLSRCRFEASRGLHELTSPTVLTLKECDGPFNLTNSFLFPNLSILELIDTDDFVYNERSPAPRFSDVHCLASGISSTRDLRLNNVYLLSGAQVILLLTELPHLMHLSIIERRASNEADPQVVTKSLLQYLYEDNVLPKLQSIKLIWRAHNPVEENMVMDILEARSGLKEIVIGRRDGGDFNENTLERMNGLRQQGRAAWLW